MYRTFFGIAQLLWNIHNRSIKSADIIKDILGYYLRTPNETRWNAISDAMDDLQKHKAKLNTVMDTLGERRFTADEFIFLDEYNEVTKPLAITLDILQGDSASLGIVLPSLVKLKRHFNNIIQDGKMKFCLPLAKFMLWDLNERTSELFEDKDYLLGD